MNLRQMQYFVAIAEDGSISRSAERLLVAQPSLSAQIRVSRRNWAAQSSNGYRGAFA